MKDILEWSRGFDVNQKPWLMLGKGPSFQRIPEVEPGRFFTLSLNHVVRELPVTAAHAIDIDVVADCAEAIDRNAGALIVPYRPHVKCKATPKTIVEFMSEIPILRKLDGEGRLVWYNLSTSPEPPHGSSPVVSALWFSAEAGLNILAACGVKIVRSLGIDGGKSYSARFEDLKDKTLLANTHESFDRQFAQIAATIRKTGIFYAPLFVEAPVRVFVGADDAQVAGVKMLEYSIKKHASLSAEVVRIDDRDVPVPADPANRSKTGFSFSRFRIPELCGYKGRGIYMDADMQVFTDILGLWNMPFDGAHVLYAEQPADKGRIPQFSVLLLDCGSLRWDVKEIVRGFDEGKYDYKQLMQQLCIVPPDKRKPALPYEWNSLERYEPGRTCLIHYTDMPTQPWVASNNKNGKLWYAALKEAVQEGFISKDFLYGEVEKGHVHPDLPDWVGLPRSPNYKDLKARWVPPFRRFTGQPASPAGNGARGGGLLARIARFFQPK